MDSYQHQKLYDIPSLPFSMLKQKYIQTSDIYHDPNTVENFMKETIRNTGSDAPLFESDMPRQSLNPMSRSLLNAYEFGGRYTHAPHHPELFMGDLTKDQRMSVNNPMVAQMADQHRFRQTRYIEGKLQDVGDVRTEGIVGEKKMVKLVSGGFGDTAKRLSDLFDDSVRNNVRRSNPNPGTTIHQLGKSVNETMKIYKNDGEKILPTYSKDRISKFSDALAVQYKVEPDAKAATSNTLSVYKSKHEGDQSIVASIRSGEQDTLFNDGVAGIKNGFSVPQFESLKQARQNIHSVEVNTGKDSIRNRKNLGSMAPPISVNLVDRFERTQKSANRESQAKGIVYKYYTGQKRQESLYEPIKTTNIETANSHPLIPTKDRLAIVYKIKGTQKMNGREDKLSTRPMSSIKSLTKALVSRTQTFDEQAKSNAMKNKQYANGIPVKSVDHVSGVVIAKSKFENQMERTANNPTGSNNLPNSITMNSFEFDTDPTMNNEFISQRGVIQKNAHLSHPQEQDSRISPLTDNVMPYRTKYKAK